MRRWLDAAWLALRIAGHVWAAGCLLAWIIAPWEILGLVLWAVSAGSALAWGVLMVDLHPWRDDPQPVTSDDPAA